MQNLITGIFLSVFLTFIFIKLFSKFALKSNLTDKPDTFRKNHIGEIPLIGGISIFIAVVFSYLLINFSSSFIFDIFLGTSVVIFFGLLDDFRPHHWILRLASQVIASIYIILNSNLLIESLGFVKFFGEINTGSLANLFTVLCVIALTNAINLLDGLDGLAGTIVLIALTALIIISGSDPMQVILIIFSVATFLHFNLGKRKYKVFLGDAGSLGLGFFLSWVLIYYSSSGLIESQQIIWFTSIPIIDTLRVMIERFKNGDKLFAADRKHLHHLLLDANMNKTSVLVIIIGLHSSLIIFGQFMSNFLPEYSYYAFLIVTLIYISFIGRIQNRN